MSGDGSPEVDVSVPILAVQRAPDVGMEVQVEGLQLLVEVLQILREGGRVIPGAPVGPCVREAWGGGGIGGAVQAPGSGTSPLTITWPFSRLRASVSACSVQGKAWGLLLSVF